MVSGCIVMVNYNKQTQIRTQLQNKVFSQFGKEVTLYKQGTPVYNSRGEVSDNDFSTETITIVNYNITNKTNNVDKWGSWNLGDMEAIIPYTVTININDRLLIEGVTYNVAEIRKPELPNVLVTIVRLEELDA